MSNVLGRTPARDEERNLPRGDTVGRYSAYLDAQKAVDYLADHKFPVERVSIIGNDLKSVERVTGRLSYPRVALTSASVGAWFGFFVGLILMLFGDGSNYLSVVMAMALGAAFWLLFGVVTYALQRGKRDFASTSQVIATSYDVIVETAVAGEAQKLLQKLPMNGQAHHPGGAAEGYAPAPGAGNRQRSPERPQGWEDPYGSRPATTSEGTSPSEGTPAPGKASVQDQPSEAVDGDAPRRGQFPDLPDGRPQYGVRVPPKP